MLDGDSENLLNHEISITVQPMFCIRGASIVSITWGNYYIDYLHLLKLEQWTNKEGGAPALFEPEPRYVIVQSSSNWSDKFPLLVDAGLISSIIVSS